MSEKFVFATKYSFIIVDAPLDCQYVINLHSILLLHHLPHVLILTIIYVIDLEFDLHLEGIVRICFYNS